MPYTSHGHWYGPGTPTPPAPQSRARCGGTRMCPVCSREAGPISRPKAETPAEAARIEYACRFTAWTNTDGIEKQVVKYDFTGIGEPGLSEARRMVRDTRAWQPRQSLPVDAAVVSRPVPEWTIVPDPPTDS